MCSSASGPLRSMSTSTDCLASRSAASTTRTATNSAATESAQCSPADTSTRPMSTANEPARSDAKCSAFAARAGEW